MIKEIVGEYIAKLGYEYNNAGIKEFGASVKNLGANIMQIGGDLTAVITVPIVETAGAAIMSASKFEDLDTRFEVLSQNAALYEELVSMSVETPFNVESLAQGAQTLMSFGIESEQVIDTLKVLGGVALGDSEKFQRLVLAFSQVRSMGWLQDETLLQLMSAGFDPLEEIACKTGKSMEVLKDEMSKGVISFDNDAFSFVVIPQKFAVDIKDFGANIMQIGGDFTATIMSASKLGDVEIVTQGAVSYEELVSMSAETPFSVKSLVQGTQTLMSFGIESEQVIVMLKVLGDVALGDSEKFQRLVFAFSQVQSMGWLQDENLLQLISSGFNPLEEIARKTGKSMEVLKDEMSKGVISFDMVNDAFTSATQDGGKFYGGMEKGSKTVSSLSLASIGESFNDETKAVLIPLVEKVRDLADLFAHLLKPAHLIDDWEKNWVNVFGGVFDFKEFFDGTETLFPLLSSIPEMMNAGDWEGIKKLLSDIWAGFVEAMPDWFTDTPVVYLVRKNNGNYPVDGDIGSGIDYAAVKAVAMLSITVGSSAAVYYSSLKNEPAVVRNNTTNTLGNVTVQVQGSNATAEQIGKAVQGSVGDAFAEVLRWNTPGFGVVNG